MKNHSGAKKRFKLTASGKVKFKRAFMRHMQSNKTKDQKRELGKAGYFASGDAKVIKRLISA